MVLGTCLNYICSYRGHACNGVTDPQFLSGRVLVSVHQPTFPEHLLDHLRVLNLPLEGKMLVVAFAEPLINLLDNDEDEG